MQPVMFRNCSPYNMKHGIIPIIIVATLSVNMVMGLEIEQVGVYDFGVAYDIVYQDDTAYVSGNDGVDIFDITDRTNPIKITRIECSNGAFGLHIVENILYVSATSQGLLLVDITDPRNPVTLSRVSEINALSVYATQEYAYVASGGSYSIIDTRESTDPEIIATVSGEERSYQICVIDDTLYLG